MKVRGKTPFLLFVVVVSCQSSALPAQEVTVDAQQKDSDDSLRLNHSQVIIIGAGASGVAAASRLMENGILDVTILEAEDRMGGRIHTVPFGDNVLDLGAQWVHGQQGNVVYEMANPLGILSPGRNDYEDDTLYLGWNGTVIDRTVMKQMLNITEIIRNDEENLMNYNHSFGQFHDEKFVEYTSNLELNPFLENSYLTWIEKFWAFSESTYWRNISSKGFNTYWECPGDQGLNWINNGYYSVINLLTKRYPNPEQELPVRNKTHFGTEVKTIHWGPRRVMGPAGKKVVLVETSDGSKFTADIVLVTVSLGVLKENADTMFNPSLPERKLNAIQHLGYGQVDKLFLNFEERWWPTNITGFNIVPMNLDRLRFNSLYPQFLEKGEWTDGLTGFYEVPMKPQHVLFDWIVGENAKNMEKYSDEEVKNGCLRWLEMFLNQSIPEPVSFTRSRWYSNPHFRGSYCFRSLDSETYDAQAVHLAEPLIGQDSTPEVLFAGEATNDHHYSTVHGAIETGWREADRILDLIRKQNESSSTTTTTTTTTKTTTSS